MIGRFETIAINGSTIVQKTSTCATGLMVRRPRRRAVLSPSRSADHACAASWIESDTINTTSPIRSRTGSILSKRDSAYHSECGSVLTRPGGFRAHHELVRSDQVGKRCIRKPIAVPSRHDQCFFHSELLFLDGRTP